MNSIKSITLVLLFWYSGYSLAAPKVHDVPLVQFTKLTVSVPVGMGVKFTLPFILNEVDSEIPFSEVLTNPLFKTVPDFTAKNLSPINYFAVYVDPAHANIINNAPSKRGNLFFNIAGYEVTIELVATKDLSKHISDYNFVLNEKAKENLIQKLVKQRSLKLENDYANLVKNNDKAIAEQSMKLLSEIMVDGLKYTSVKEKTSAVLDNGDKIELLIADIITAGSYTVLPFTFYNNANSSDGVSINSARVFSVDPDTDNLTPINGIFNMPKRIDADTELSGTFIYTGLLHDNYTFQVLVDNKTMELSW